MKRTPLRISAVIAFTAALSLPFTACTRQQPIPSAQPAGTVTEAPAPAANAAGPIWTLLGSEAQQFAADFSTDNVLFLTCTVIDETSNDYTTFDDEKIRGVFDALNAVQITGKTDESILDSGHTFAFTLLDGSEITVPFEGDHLVAGKTAFTTAGTDALWAQAQLIVDEYAFDLDEEDDEETDDAAYASITSLADGFTFQYRSDYTAFETDGGMIEIELGHEEYFTVIDSWRMMGPDAEGYLQSQADMYRGYYEGSLIEEPNDPEAVEFNGRTIYATELEAATDDGVTLDITLFAEDLDDGSVFAVTAYYIPDNEDEAAAATQKIFETVTFVPADQVDLESTGAPADENPEGWDNPDGLGGDGRGDDEGGDSGLLDYGDTEGWTWEMYMLSDGTLEYDIDGVLFLQLPNNWLDKYEMEVTGNYVNFYHTASRQKFLEEAGYDGGWLFSVGWSYDESYKELPNYQYIGKAADGKYFFEFPSDVQAYVEDEAVLAEWSMLMEGMNFIKGSAYSTV